MNNLITKLIKVALGVLGVALVDSCVAKAEYGCPYADTLWTNHSGEYITGESYIDDDFAYMDSVKLEFEDVDGQENGGEFQNVTIEVPVFKVKEGDGNWYDGAYETGANVTMIKK